jgi:hypothetical protein
VALLIQSWELACLLAKKRGPRDLDRQEGNKIRFLAAQLGIDVEENVFRCVACARITWSAERRGTGPRAPVGYRENSMAYEPEKLLDSYPLRKSPRWISRSVLNPVRRYYTHIDPVVSTSTSTQFSSFFCYFFYLYV